MRALFPACLVVAGAIVALGAQQPPPPAAQPPAASQPAQPPASGQQQPPVFRGGTPADDMSLPIRSSFHAAAEAARDDIRVFVIFWDEYHVGEMAPAIRARQALSNFVQFAFGPTDLVALMDQLTPTDAIRFTRDR